MKVLLDMNLSPSWSGALTENGIAAIHWSSVGRDAAPDVEIYLWAKANGYIVPTNDLDFGAILAATRAEGPSVILLRLLAVSPALLLDRMVGLLRELEEILERGALVVVDEDRARVRVLPLN